jgi:hypothetical protein
MRVTVVGFYCVYDPNHYPEIEHIAYVIEQYTFLSLFFIYFFQQSIEEFCSLAYFFLVLTVVFLHNVLHEAQYETK